MEVLLYSLSVYFFYHLIGRSDLCAGLREWAIRTYPAAITYPVSCAYCFAFHVSWIAALCFGINWRCVLVAPVINYLIDLWVESKLKANG